MDSLNKTNIDASSQTLADNIVSSSVQSLPSPRKAALNKDITGENFIIQVLAIN